MRAFLASHKFGQRNPKTGVEQSLHHTHQVDNSGPPESSNNSNVLKGMDMLHEEVIRHELACLDRRKLVRNELTGSFERDDEVFQNAARWLGFYGDKWIKDKGSHDLIWSCFDLQLFLVERDQQKSRRYPKFYKTVLALRQQIRSSGFLNGFSNPELPFYSSDLKQVLATFILTFPLFLIKGTYNIDALYTIIHVTLSQWMCIYACVTLYVWWLMRSPIFRKL